MMYRRTASVLTFACAGILAHGFLSGSAAAQDRPDRPQPPRRAGGQPAILKTYVNTHTTRLEVELAGLIQKRAETSAADSGYLELQIDLRILQRWLVQQITEPDAYSDGQAVVWLRHRDLSDVITMADGWAPSQKGVVASRQQAEAMIAIRKATYSLKAIESVSDLDAVLVPLRSPLLLALGDKVGKAPDMRPTLKSAPTTNKTVATAPVAPSAEPLTMDQISVRVAQLAVSIPLRQQLLAAVAAAKTSEGEERDKMLGVLRTAVELASAIQAGVGVDATSRVQLELQIGDAVALFSDARLREAGEKRLNDLSQYRQLAGRISSMGLTPEISRQLSPAFAYARENPADGAKVLAAIESFAELDRAMIQHRPMATADVIGRQVEGQFKAYSAHRADFLGDVERLKGGGAFSANADDLVNRIDLMKRSVLMMETLKRWPQVQTTLLELKPRPTGALEKKATQMLVKLSDNDPDQQAASRAFVTELDALASAWTSAQQSLAKPVDPAIVQKYTGTTWAALEARARSLATETVSAAATAGTVDTTKLDSLKRITTVIERLRTFAALDSKLSVNAAVNRWADCAMTDEKLTKLLDGYRSDFGEIVTATLQGTGDDKQVDRLTRRYHGLLQTLDRIAGAAEACAELPDGPRGQIARLTTPSDKAGFAQIRYLSFMTDLIEVTRMSADADVEAINKIQDQMLNRLNR